MKHLEVALSKTAGTRKLVADELRAGEDARCAKKAKFEKASNAYYKALRM